MQISLDGARALLLTAQGLDRPPQQTAHKEDVLAAIRRMGALQIDTISVVARSHLLVLWSRVGDFDLRWLDELLAEAALFEYWSHAACFLPIEDFPLYRPAMLRRSDHSRLAGWSQENAGLVEAVLERIRLEGAVRAAQFERTGGPAGPWWDRKPEKWALEELYHRGLLMIARREGFQRVYDLQERVLPGWTDASLPSAGEEERELALKAVRALGIAPARWVADYFRRPKRGIAEVLKGLEADGALIPVTVADLGPAYVHPDHSERARAAAAGELQSSVTTLLSPFDPVVWDRARARELFGFEYKIEVYTPAEQRKFGYFTMPILHRGALVGRLCPKAHRREGTFEVRRLHLEPGVAVTEALVSDLGAALRACADWHRTPEVVIRESDPPSLAEALRASIRA